MSMVPALEGRQTGRSLADGGHDDAVWPYLQLRLVEVVGELLHYETVARNELDEGVRTRSHRVSLDLVESVAVRYRQAPERHVRQYHRAVALQGDGELVVAGHLVGGHLAQHVPPAPPVGDVVDDPVPVPDHVVAAELPAAVEEDVVAEREDDRLAVARPVPARGQVRHRVGHRAVVLHQPVVDEVGDESSSAARLDEMGVEVRRVDSRPDAQLGHLRRSGSGRRGGGGRRGRRRSRGGGHRLLIRLVVAAGDSDRQHDPKGQYQYRLQHHILLGDLIVLPDRCPYRAHYMNVKVGRYTRRPTMSRRRWASVAVQAPLEILPLDIPNIGAIIILYGAHHPRGRPILINPAPYDPHAANRRL